MATKTGSAEAPQEIAAPKMLFAFPEHGRTVEAETLAEAAEIINGIIPKN
jgi:hypothetical protein